MADACVKCSRMVPLYTYYGNARYYDGSNNMCRECDDEVYRECAKKYGYPPAVAEPLPENASEQLSAKRQCRSADLYIMCLSTDPSGLLHGLKIGRTSKIEERARSLVTEFPFEMVVRATFPGLGHLDESVHTHLAAKRNKISAAREWFHVTLAEALVVFSVRWLPLRRSMSIRALRKVAARSLRWSSQKQSIVVQTVSPGLRTSRSPSPGTQSTYITTGFTSLKKPPNLSPMPGW